MRELSGKSECRGRNGWFKAKQFDASFARSSMIDGETHNIVVAIHSKQLGDHPPIWMWLTVADAKNLVGAMTNAIIDAGGFQPKPSDDSEVAK